MFTDRTFGVEIEFIGTKEKALEAIKTAGISCHIEAYDIDHRVPTEWKITHDRSIGYENGELVSPILRGQDGLDQVRKVLRALRGIGHTVNRSCGVHVHVGVRDLTGADIVNVFQRYQKHELEIDGFMPVSRRANNNSNYIRSLRDIDFRDCDSVYDVRDEMDEDRYFKLNVMSYFRQKTLEFRQHGGSLSGEKVCNWIKFCVNFIEVSRVPVVEEVAAPVPRTMATNTANVAATPARRGRRPSENSAKAKIINHFRNVSPILRNWQASELGVSAASLPGVISALRNEGWQISRNRGYSYYYACTIPAVATSTVVVNTVTCATTNPSVQYDNVPPRQVTPPSRPALVVPDTLYMGLDENTVQYFHERAAEFAER